MEGHWDGFMRINTETKSGGLIGVFRHGAAEQRRAVTISQLDSRKTYLVKKMNGDIVVSASGAVLQSKGFNVTLTRPYDGELFEIGLR